MPTAQACILPPLPSITLDALPVMNRRSLEYAATLAWTGNTGSGTSHDTAYDREYQVRIAGKPDLAGSADPAFRGDPMRHNPEELFLAAVGACHMLTYLGICARRGVQVLAYHDAMTGTVRLDPAGGGAFEEIVLRPSVTVARAGEEGLALQLHDAAHRACLVAASCRVHIACRPSITVGDAPGQAQSMTAGSRVR